jgi:hypothetical protein
MLAEAAAAPACSSAGAQRGTQGDSEALSRDARDATALDGSEALDVACASASVLGADELRCVFAALLTVDDTGRSLGRCVRARCRFPAVQLVARPARREKIIGVATHAVRPAALLSRLPDARASGRAWACRCQVPHGSHGVARHAAQHAEVRACVGVFGQRTRARLSGRRASACALARSHSPAACAASG